MKESKKISVEKLCIAILISIAILILFVSMRFINSESSSGPVDDSRNNLQNTSIIANGTVIITEEDRKFQNWTNLLSDYMKSDLYCIAEAGKKKNLIDTEICGRILKENSNRSIRQISEFNVSPSFEMIVSEYKKSLELYYLGGKNLEIGSKNSDIQLMSDAITYIDQGKKRMSNAHYLLGLIS